MVSPLAAAKAGLKSIVIDALPEAARTQEDFDGRGYALALSSVRMLDNLGLWERLEPNVQPMREI